ncbi:MAG: ABC transporter ATP-binding protein [Chitinophagaceae bacterium]
MEPILQVDQVKKYFTTQKAVDDVSFSIPKGSIFGLLGPNGAGKTTLLRMITGILYPDNGSILLNGELFKPVKDAGLIGYMPEERGLYKKMKIGEQALYLAQLKGLSKSEALTKIKEWFIKFEMQTWWNKKVEDLSKGMSQKLQFVTTVLHEPELIILDEPFSGLDPVNANLIKDEIFRLAEKGSTIIFSTHRMEQVEEICDHIILMNKGKKILDGTVKAIKQEHKEHLFQVQFSQQPNEDILENKAYEIIHKKANTLLIRKNTGFNNNQILHYFMESGLEINTFNEILPSLNDIFIQLVEGNSATRQFEKNPV